MPRRLIAASLVMLYATGCGTSEGSAPTGPTPLVWSPWQGVVIAGRLIDFKTGEPTPGRRITLGTHQLTTDEHGSYSLVVPSGDYAIDIEGENVDTYIHARGRTTNGNFYVNGGDCASSYGMIRDRVRSVRSRVRPSRLPGRPSPTRLAGIAATGPVPAASSSGVLPS